MAMSTPVSFSSLTFAGLSRSAPLLDEPDFDSRTLRSSRKDESRLIHDLSFFVIGRQITVGEQNEISGWIKNWFLPKRRSEHGSNRSSKLR